MNPYGRAVEDSIRDTRAFLDNSLCVVTASCRESAYTWVDAVVTEIEKKTPPNYLPQTAEINRAPELTGIITHKLNINSTTHPTAHTKTQPTTQKIARKPYQNRMQLTTKNAT